MSFVTLVGPAKPITRSGIIGQCRRVGMTDEQAEAQFRRMLTMEYWGNDTYTVAVDRNSDLNHFPKDAGITVVHMSIHRRDRAPCTDWRDFQRIKNDVCGPNVEAVQLHPAQWRVVDTSNEYHLFAILGPPDDPFPVWPVGFTGGLQTDTGPLPDGAVQRKFDPSDNLPPRDDT